MPRFLLLTFFASFVWLQSHMILAESPNSDAKSGQSSSKALNTARLAELELKKPSNEGLGRAITILEQLLQDTSFRRLQIDERLNIYKMLSFAYQRDRKFQQQEELINQLLKDKAFKPYKISLKVLLADSYLAQDRVIQASKIMKELLRTPKRRLSVEDANSVSDLHSHIEQHTERKAKIAEKLYSQKDYKAASQLYQYLLDAALSHASIQTFSKISFTTFLDELSMRLSLCYYMQKQYAKSLKVFLSHHPNHTSSYILQGMAEKNSGQHSQAFKTFKKIDTPNNKILEEAFLCATKVGPELMQEVFLILHDKQLLETNYSLFEKIIYFFLENNQPENAANFLESALLQQHKTSLIEKSHWLYIFSLISCARKNPEHDTEKTLWLCDQFLKKYPESQFYADVLFQKAMLLWQLDNLEEALKAFSLLEAKYGHAGNRDKVLFFMGSIIQKKTINNTDSRPYYLELYTEYPHSCFAPESYYRMFDEHLYASGDTQAIGHLKKMPKFYANSPYGVLAAFYIAAYDREQCPQKSLSATQVKTLTEVINALDTAIDTGKTISSRLPPKMCALLTVRILHAEYDKAECHFTLANFSDVLTCCDTLKSQISSFDRNPLITPHLLWQKASYLKSRALLLQGNESQAREELKNMLEYSQNNGCEKGEPFVLALIDLARAFDKEETTEAAFILLNKAQAANAEGMQGIQVEELQVELLLEILIAKSQLHRKNGELDKAMMLLSSVINEKSASNLRIQAMFLRSEIYELKGRRDLAFRQLQSTAKKGGEWGLMAAKKLEEKYGY